MALENSSVTSYIVTILVSFRCMCLDYLGLALDCDDHVSSNVTSNE